MLKYKMPNYKRIFQNRHSYFLTMTTHGRNPILIENIELLRKSFWVSQQNYDYEIDAIVVLPDHIHMILTLDNAKNYPKIIRNIKQYFSKRCDVKYYVNYLQSKSREAEGYFPIWQKRFFEHTIRNEKDLAMILEYMVNNPVKHGLVENREDWKYSSFYKRLHP